MFRVIWTVAFWVNNTSAKVTINHPFYLYFEPTLVYKLNENYSLVYSIFFIFRFVEICSLFEKKCSHRFVIIALAR